MKDLDKQVIKLYNEDNFSTYEIAKQLETYPNKIRRILIKHGYELKDKSAAQKAALESGRSSHPTAGTKRTKEQRVMISKGLSSYWEKLSNSERNKRIKQAKDNWQSMSAEQKEKMRSKVLQLLESQQKKVLNLRKNFNKESATLGFKSKCTR